MRIGNSWMVMAGVCAALALAPAARGQQGDTSNTSAPFGSEGSGWQAEMELAKEELRQFMAELEKASLDEWKQGATAWVEVTRGESESAVLSVPASYHVGGLEIARGEVNVDDPYHPQPQWEIRYEKKLPRDLTLVLTDVDSTRISCPLRQPLETGARAYLGVFVRGTAVECFARSEG